MGTKLDMEAPQRNFVKNRSLAEGDQFLLFLGRVNNSFSPALNQRPEHITKHR